MYNNSGRTGRTSSLCSSGVLKVQGTTNSSNSDWREGFLFLGNNPALDFINTRPAPNGEPQELLTDWHSLLRWFQAAELIDVREAATLERRWSRSVEAHKTLEAMRDFREKLRKELLSWEGGAPLRTATLQGINELLSRHPMLTKLNSQKGKLITTQCFSLQKPRDLFAPLAHAAAKLFSESDPKRTRKCEHCILHFQDTSKIGTRRWCSMRLCGNRAKVAAYTARQKKE